jgi:phage minor structural protein
MAGEVDRMTFTFFDAADLVLFSRGDAERATWTVEELSLSADFPFDPEKQIRRGMRTGFTDADGKLQVFEVRKVRTLEPGHTQEITAEHIAVAELTDEVYQGAEVTDETAAAVLEDVLDGTLWSVGEVSAENVSSADFQRNNVWGAVREIERSWNVYLIPRITADNSGITGRYLDIVPAGGEWRGIRLSVEKNADEVGVTVDDTETVTALYGYGQTTNDEPLTFADVVWEETAEHPAKPAGQEYIEDPAATAAYGRNGRPRFAYWTNGAIKDKNILLEQTWKYLQTTNAPKVTIECRIADLYRLGYADEPIRLHDIAVVDIAQTGTHLREQIISLTVDLLDPTQTRAVIGAYIPNIIYIDRDTGKKARGGGGGRGNDPNEEEEIKFNTSIERNQYEIQLTASKTDKNDSILAQAGMRLNSQGILIYDADNENMLQSKLNVQANRISLVVTDTENPSIKPAAIVASINQSSGQSSIKLSASTIDIDGIVKALSAFDISTLSLTVTGGLTVSGAGYFDAVYTDTLYPDQMSIGDGNLVVGNKAVSWQETRVLVSVTANMYNSARRFWYSGGSLTEPDGAVGGAFVGSLSPSYKTLHYLGSDAT